MRQASVSIEKGGMTYREDLTLHAIVEHWDLGSCRRR